MSGTSSLVSLRAPTTYFARGLLGPGGEIVFVQHADGCRLALNASAFIVRWLVEWRDKIARFGRLF